MDVISKRAMLSAPGLYGLLDPLREFLIVLGHRNLIGQRGRIEAEIRTLTKHYDAASNVYTVKAVIDFPCMKCGKTLSASESIGQLDVKSVIGELNCQNCDILLQVIQSEHKQEELSTGMVPLRKSSAI